MTDIVTRLRQDITPAMKQAVAPCELLLSAADEIERLRRVNQELVDCLNGISRNAAAMAKANSSPSRTAEITETRKRDDGE